MLFYYILRSKDQADAGLNPTRRQVQWLKAKDVKKCFGALRGPEMWQKLEEKIAAWETEGRLFSGLFSGKLVRDFCCLVVTVRYS